MKYFIDTEFIEYPCTINLISIGIKCEDGRTLYAESTCFDERKASPWVKKNVISKLRWYGNINAHKGFCNCATNEGKTEVFGTLDLIHKAVLDFIGEDIPEFWGYYADYDWVVFCWLFGTMENLPKGWPMYCRDLKQIADDIGNPKIAEPEGEHNVLVDACWNEKFYHFLLSAIKYNTKSQKEISKLEEK